MNLVAGVLSRWDAVWYLLLAQNGYDNPRGLPSPDGPDQWGASIGFMPAYPALVRVLSGFTTSHGVFVVMAYLVSLVAYGVALYLLYRLTELELEREDAVWVLVLLAVFPGAVFFGIPYTESLFLALSVGSFWAARTGKWPLACVLAAAGALTRPTGILLVVPLAVFYLYGPSGREPRRPIRADAAWLMLVPAALLSFVAYSWYLTGDVLAYSHTSELFKRSFTDPFSAFWKATTAAVDGFGVIFLGNAGGPDPLPDAIIDFTRYIGMLGATWLTVAVWRRLGRAYGAYCAVSLVVILCTGTDEHPLLNALRYLAVLFPLFMVLAPMLRVRRPAAIGFVALSALALAAITVQFARWWYVG